MTHGAGFLGNRLASDVGEIRFLEWRQGSVRVPCIMPTFLARLLWELLRAGDDELLQFIFAEGPHALRAVEMDGLMCVCCVCARARVRVRVCVSVCLSVCLSLCVHACVFVCVIHIAYW